MLGDAVPPEKAGAVPPRQTGAVPPSDRPNLAELAHRLRDAAGTAINTAHPAFINLAEPLGWIDSGCDLELDILPTLEGLAARARGSPVRTWGYFAGAVLEARDRRLAARENVVASPGRPQGRFTKAFARRRIQLGEPADGGGVAHSSGNGRFSAAAADLRESIAQQIAPDRDVIEHDGQLFGPKRGDPRR